MAAAVSDAHVTETDMHVQHSEQTARGQLAISPLPTDSAQVALNVESMPEQAIVNSTTHDAAQLADSLCSGGGEAQQASAQLVQRPGSQRVVAPSEQSPPGFDPAGIGVVTDSLAQRRSELLLEQNRKQTQMRGGEQNTGAAESIQSTGNWNGAGAPAQREQWSGAQQTVGPVGVSRQSRTVRSQSRWPATQMMRSCRGRRRRRPQTQGWG